MPLLGYLFRGKPSIPRDPIMMVPRVNTRRDWQRETLLLNSSFFLYPFWAALGVTVRRDQGGQAQCRERGQDGRFSRSIIRREERGSLLHLLDAALHWLALSSRGPNWARKCPNFCCWVGAVHFFLTGGCSAARS